MRSLDSSELARSKSVKDQPFISFGIILERGWSKEMGGAAENAKKSFNPNTEKKARNPVVKIKTFIRWENVFWEFIYLVVYLT